MNFYIQYITSYCERCGDSASRSSTFYISLFKQSCPLCKVVHSGVMVWFAHVADGADLESWSSKEPVLGVNATLTQGDGFKSPVNPELLKYSMSPHIFHFSASISIHKEPSNLRDISRG